MGVVVIVVVTVVVEIEIIGGEVMVIAGNVTTGKVVVDTGRIMVVVLVTGIDSMYLFLVIVVVTVIAGTSTGDFLNTATQTPDINQYQNYYQCHDTENQSNFLVHRFSL